MASTWNKASDSVIQDILNARNSIMNNIGLQPQQLQYVMQTHVKILKDDAVYIASDGTVTNIINNATQFLGFAIENSYNGIVRVELTTGGNTMRRQRRSNMLDNRIREMYKAIRASLRLNNVPYNELVELAVLLYKREMISDAHLDKIEAKMNMIEKVQSRGAGTNFENERMICERKAFEISNSIFAFINNSCQLTLLVAMNCDNTDDAFRELKRFAKGNVDFQKSLDAMLRKHGVKS